MYINSKPIATKIVMVPDLVKKICKKTIMKNLVPRIQNSRFLLTSDNITTPLYALCGIIRFVRLGHNIKNPKFDQNPLRIE